MALSDLTPKIWIRELPYPEAENETWHGWGPSSVDYLTFEVKADRLYWCYDNFKGLELLPPN